MIRYFVRTTGERTLNESFSQIEYTLLVDTEHNSGKAFIKQLLEITKYDSVVLEDDIILCKDFKNRIEKVISKHPNDIINFFQHPMNYESEGYSKRFVYNQCTYFPKGVGEKIYNVIKNIVLKERQGQEFILQTYLKEVNGKCYIYKPCLVQHIDDGSLMKHDVSFCRRSPYFIDYLDEIGITYEEASTQENQMRLTNMMIKQFREIDKIPVKNKDILIVGYDTIGRNLYNELKKLKPDIYDKHNINFRRKDVNTYYKFAFICIDTPYIDKNNSCDMSQIREAIIENDADIYIIKSTVLPGTTEQLSKEFNKHIIFSPSYYDENQCDIDFNFTILGGEEIYCYAVQQLLQNVYDGRHTFKVVDAKTAELCKYMDNSFLATKTAFCCQFYEMCQELKIPYEKLRELFILDSRVNPFNTFVYNDHPYCISQSLNQDIDTIAHYTNAKLLNDIIDFNDGQKNKYKK